MVHRAFQLAGFAPAEMMDPYVGVTDDLFMGERGVESDNRLDKRNLRRGIISSLLGALILGVVSFWLVPLLHPGVLALLVLFTIGASPLLYTAVLLLDSNYFQSDVVRVRVVPTDSKHHPLPEAHLEVTAARVRSQNLVTKSYGSFRVFSSVLDPNDGPRWSRDVVANL